MLTMAGDITLPFTFSFFLGLAAWAGVYELSDAKDWVEKASKEALSRLPLFSQKNYQVRQRLEEEPIKWLDRTCYLWLLSGAILLGHSFLLLGGVTKLSIWDVSILLYSGICLLGFGWFHYLCLWQFRNHSTSSEPFQAIWRLNQTTRVLFLAMTALFLFFFASTYGLIAVFSGASVITGFSPRALAVTAMFAIGSAGACILMWAILPFSRKYKTRELVFPLALFSLPIAVTAIASYLG